MPGAPGSFLFLVVRPGAPSSVLVNLPAMASNLSDGLQSNEKPPVQQTSFRRNERRRKHGESLFVASASAVSQPKWSNRLPGHSWPTFDMVLFSWG